MVLTLLVVQSFGAAAIGRFSNIPLDLRRRPGDRRGLGAAHEVRERHQRVPRRTQPERPVHRALRRADRDAALEAGRPSGPASPGPPRGLARPRQGAGSSERAADARRPRLRARCGSVHGCRRSRSRSATSCSSCRWACSSRAPTRSHSRTSASRPPGAWPSRWRGSSGACPGSLSLLVAALITIPIGALIALPAIRLSGIYLALATFAFGLILEVMFYNSELMFGPSTAGLPMPRPQALGLDTDLGYYYLVLAVVAACTLFLVLLQRMRLGPPAPRARGVARSRSRPAAPPCGSRSSSSSASPRAWRRWRARSTEAPSPTSVASPSTSFSSLILLVLLLLMPGGEPWYAVIGAFCAGGAAHLPAGRGDGGTTS